MAVSAAEQRRIARYYDECEDDYSLIWDLGHSRAMHIGYWDSTTWTLRQALQRHREVLAEFGRVRPGDKILDAGCGVGGCSIFLAKLGCDVTGVTLSEKQVERCRANAARNGVADRTRFHVMDYSRTTFAAGSFDVVWALESSCYAPDKRKFVREARRLLRPGGRLVLSDGFTTRECFDRGERDLLETWLRGWAVDHLASTAQMLAYFEEAGFARIRFADIQRNVLPSSRLMFASSIVALPVGRVLQCLGLRTEAQQRNVVSGIAQFEVWRRGLATYALFCGTKPGPRGNGLQPTLRRRDRATSARPG